MAKTWVKLTRALSVSLLVVLLMGPICFTVSAAPPELPPAPIAPTAPFRYSPYGSSNELPITQAEPAVQSTDESTAAPIGDDAASAVPEPIETEGETAEAESLSSAAPMVESVGGLSVENENTGAGSENDSMVPDTGSINISNDNEADVENEIALDADSGGNNANYNTGDGSVVSGDANVVLSILNLINTVFFSPSGGQFGLFMGNILGDLLGDYIVGPEGETYSLTGSRLDVGNSNTGADSTNTAIVNAGADTTVNNYNDGALDNNIDINASTGGNEASYNTGDGSVKSGDANVSLNLLNFLNSTFYAQDYGLLGILNIFGNFIGNLVIPDSMANSDTSGTELDLGVSNDSTGAGSENDAVVNVENDLDINNDNTVDINNGIAIAGNSGNNESGYNTGSGKVESGDVDTNLNVGNTANQTIVGDKIFYAVINVLGEWSGFNALASLFKTYVLPNPSGEGQTIVITNANTGANSENDASVNLSQETEINNTNNAEINNDISIAANTGDNDASYNTGDGSVESGNVNILANIFNFANLNVVANRFAFFVINIFGDWDGNISSEGSKQATAEPVVNAAESVIVNDTSSGVASHAYSYATELLGALETTEPLSVDDSVTVSDTDSNENKVAAAMMSTPGTPTQGFLAQNIWRMFIYIGAILLITSLVMYVRERRKERVMKWEVNVL